MSSRYGADGKRLSSKTHARRSHTCELCGAEGRGNGFASSHGRSHVRRGEAVELVREYEGLMSPSRLFLRVGDPRIEEWLERGYREVEA